MAVSAQNSWLMWLYNDMLHFNARVDGLVAQHDNSKQYRKAACRALCAQML